MNTLAIQKKYTDIRNSLRGFSSKEFLVFLFFLLISAAFWFMSTLNDIYEREYAISVEIVDVPSNIVITESLPDTIRVTLRDKGFVQLSYEFSDKWKNIKLRFGSYANSKGRGIVSMNEISKILKPILESTTSITAIKADRWDFYYSHGTMKKVPILVEGQLVPAPNYYISRTVMTPDSATVYASDNLLDSIRAVYTTPVNITGLNRSTTNEVTLQHINGAKVEPKRASMTIITDQMTELILNVPIKVANVPEGTMVKLFPARVDVRVAVGLKHSTQVRPEMFTIEADYNDIVGSTSDKVGIRITTQPKGIVRASLTVNKVDYIVEQ